MPVETPRITAQAEADLQHARHALEDGDFEWRPSLNSVVIKSIGEDQVGVDLFAFTKKEFERLRRSSPGWYQAIASGVEI